MQTDKINDYWNHIQDISNCNNSIASVVPILNSSRTKVAHGGVPVSRPVLTEEPVTLKALRAENLQRRSAAQQARFLQAAENEGQGEHFNIKSLKTGRDRVGGADHKLIYVRWHQEAVAFIGLDRRRVRYDGLTQEQRTAGLTAIAAE